MAIEPRNQSPTKLPERPRSTSLSQRGSAIQREPSVATSETESTGSTTSVGTPLSLSRPATRDPSYEVSTLTPEGSHISAGSTLAIRIDSQTFPDPRGSRTTTVPLRNERTPSPLSLTITAAASASAPDDLIERRSTSPAISRTPTILTPVKKNTPTSVSNLERLLSPAVDEKTALLAPKVINPADVNPSAFELPAYLKCDFITQIFSWALNHLYELVKEFVDSLRWENFTRPFGEGDNSIIRFMVLTMWVNNLVGMIAQGLLGGLNAEDFASSHISNAVTLSISVLIIFTIAAMEGKRRLVGMFNQMAVERIPARIDNFPQNVTKADVLLSAVTWPVKVVISGVFGVLAQVSLSKEYGAARVLLKYHQPWANSAADFLTSMPVTTISMFSAFTINLIGFPTKFALLTVLGSLDRALQTPAYKNRQAQVQHYIDALLLHVISLYENNRHNEIRALLDQVRARPESNIIDKTIGYVVANGISLPQHETWARYIARQAKALTFFGISVYGISNFYSVAEQFLIPFLNLPESLGPPIGALAMTGMTALCFMAVYVPFSTKEPELRILTTGEKIRNWTATITMCGLGALTNLQQAIMTNSLTNPIAIGISYGSAFLSPVLIEVNGYYTYTTTPIVKKRIANNANLKTAHETVEFFRSTRNSVTNLNEDKLNSHYETTDNTATRESRPPKYLPILFFKSLKRPSPSATEIEREFVLMESGQERRAIN